MKALVTIVLLASAGLGSFAQDTGRRTNDVSAAYRAWEEHVGEPEEVTCTPAYYQRAGDGFLVHQNYAEPRRCQQNDGD